jgi:hypothetical protein
LVLFHRDDSSLCLCLCPCRRLPVSALFDGRVLGFCCRHPTPCSISQATFSYEEYPEVMSMLWKRILKDANEGKNWRRIYKVGVPEMSRTRVVLCTLLLLLLCVYA